MASHEKEKTSKGFVIAIVIIIIIAILAILMLNSDSFKQGFMEGFNSSVLNEVLTEENYNEITSEVADELGDSDDLYYLTYATIYHMAEDGISAVFSEDSEEESAMYENIYGKTSKELIEEGKALMEENNMTVEEYKNNLANSNTIIE